MIPFLFSEIRHYKNWFKNCLCLIQLNIRLRILTLFSDQNRSKLLQQHRYKIFHRCVTTLASQVFYDVTAQALMRFEQLILLLAEIILSYDFAWNFKITLRAPVWGDAV